LNVLLNEAAMRQKNENSSLLNIPVNNSGD
jgi:hypothetical protein